MSVPKTLLGTSRVVPERKETGWGAQVTAILDDLIDVANAVGTLVGSTVLVAFSVGTASLAAAATLTQTATLMRIQGDSAARTLSTVTPIAAGTTNGQLLILVGAHVANTITIQASGNVRLNGDITLGLGHAVVFFWNSSLTLWEEVCRSN